MEVRLYRRLYTLMQQLPHTARRAREQFADWWVVMMHLWAVLHDRPASWACDERNWPADLDRPLISQSRLSRRVRTLSVLQLIERAMSAAADLFPAQLLKQIDSKPLTVGAYSKDQQASRGRLSNGQFSRGYRLHMITAGRVPLLWTLAPMNEHDSVLGTELLCRLPGEGYVLADNAYDSNACHASAASAGHQLVAPPRKCNKGVRDLEANNPQRLRGLDLIDSPLEHCGQQQGFGSKLYNSRQRIESSFGGMSWMGLGPLPPWVRGPRRTALWTAGKILCFLMRTALNKRLIA